MGLWTDHVVPRLADRMLDVEAVRRARAQVCSGLTGKVLELGFGSGLNVPHYPRQVQSVWAVDPSEVGRRLADRRVRGSTVPVRHQAASAEALPFPDATFDSALSTFTLCTVPDVREALRELVRVLVPGGRFHFLEHGRSPDADVHRWQRRLGPLNYRLAGGCNLDRDITALLGEAGLEVVGCETYYGEGPRAFAYRYQGIARRRPEPA
jgi:ubiquinone/menaquinone biosynthesis C-methylase UbiE